MIGKQFGTNLYRRLSMTPLSTNIYPAIGYQPSNFRTPLPRQLPSSQSIPMP
ncbi:unnamed protein product, partial [Rotaria magnacalcarata]